MPLSKSGKYKHILLYRNLMPLNLWAPILVSKTSIEQNIVAKTKEVDIVDNFNCFCSCKKRSVKIKLRTFNVYDASVFLAGELN